MKIVWKISQSDTRAIKNIVKKYEDHPMIRDRIKRNLSETKPIVSQSRFWRGLVGALLTTQQRSGPKSAVSSLINMKPFPLSYNVCVRQRTKQAFFQKTLFQFGGIRRHETIADELAENLAMLQNGLWAELNRELRTLCVPATREQERAVAEFLDDNLKGLGPKQARNVLQALGLTRYEIPIDSRITKWLNELPFPVRLGAAGLADRHYYGFVLDGICHLCDASDVYPCIMDAAVFASFDGDGWTPENVGW